MTASFTFKKHERLSYKRHIDELFQEGTSFSISPLRIIYKVNTSLPEAGVKLMISVPKKKFKRAVDRNAIKRLIREAYRLNKHLLYTLINNYPVNLYVGIIFTGTHIPGGYSEIEKTVMMCLERLGKAVTGNQKSEVKIT